MSTALAATNPAPGRLELAALGTSALLMVSASDQLERAVGVLRAELADIDRVCSRFRADSEISELHRNAGRAVTVSPLLAEALEAALRAAELTGGLVDPTVGEAVRALGYDCDFGQVIARESASDFTEPQAHGPASRELTSGPAPGWWRLHWDAARRELLLPRGIALDLGATAKALAADRAAIRAAEVTGSGALVSLGGDLRIAGPPPDGGWQIAVADDHRNALAHPDQIIEVRSGGLATSSTVARTWRRDGQRHHHIVDPRTGHNPPLLWRTVTVAAGSCLDANIASTAAIVLGTAAPSWLTARGLPARLVAPDGRVEYTSGWPADEEGE